MFDAVFSLVGISKKIDYMYLTFLLLSLGTLRFFSRYQLFGFVTHGHIRRKLNELNEILVSQVILESGYNADSGLRANNTAGWATAGLGFTRRKTRNIPVADEREIEKRLIEILELIDQIPQIVFRPEFIFVFDELDKVEPHQNYSLTERSSENSAGNGVDHLYAIDAARGRQQRILKILSNLKHFLNIAKAKFIFIAGREMFDASMADVSDRNYFMGSIFHDVLYVESFLKDSWPDRGGDITNLAEQYVCQYLIPQSYINSSQSKEIIARQNGEKNLHVFRQYLIDEKIYSGIPVSDLNRTKKLLSELRRRNGTNSDKLSPHFLSILKARGVLRESHFDVIKNINNKVSNGCESEQKIEDCLKELVADEKDLYVAIKERQQLEKVISSLKRFINYVTYRSNGAPKKITQFFEDYVVSKTTGEISADLSDNIVVRNYSEHLFLEFDESTQYTFGLTNYLMTPFMLIINKSIEDYSDKLLVSTSFVLDHLFKYHKAGFSWRQLELMPEIIDINKAPQLREMIQEIIIFLSNTHIDLIVSGLYDFRFSKKVVEELAYASKISELQSAAFNFTLDESLAAKQHYGKQIERFEKKYSKLEKYDPHFIHSLSFYYMILGDLHYADEEFDDAIVSYQEALQFLRRIEQDENATYAEVITYTRNMLKLGLVYERKKTYDSAFIAYGMITKLITKFARKIDSFFLQESADNFFKSAILEGIRLIYQPFVAKLELIEKANLGGITHSDLQRSDKKVEFILSKTKPAQEHYMVACEFNNKTGDILFFKNGCVFAPNDKLPPASSLTTETPPILTEEIECGNSKNNSAFFSKNMHVDHLWQKGYKTPCKSCHYYLKSIRILYDHFLGIDPGKIGHSHFLYGMFKGVSRNFHHDKTTAKFHTAMITAANCLSDIGDTFLSCSSRRELIGRDFWEMFFYQIGSEPSAKKNKNLLKFLTQRDIKAIAGHRNQTLNKIEEVLLCFYASGIYFARAGDHGNYGYQLTKILYVIRDYISIQGFNTFINQMPQTSGKDAKEPAEGKKLSDREVAYNFIEKLREMLVLKAVRGIYRAFSNAHRLEIAKYRKIFVHETDSEFDARHVDLNSVSQAVDIRELMIVFYEISLKLRVVEDFPISRKSISPYASFNSVYNRIVELRYKASLCDKILKSYHLDLPRKIWETCEHSSLSNIIEIILEAGKTEYYTPEKKLQLIWDLVVECHKLRTIFQRKESLQGKHGLRFPYTEIINARQKDQTVLDARKKLRKECHPDIDKLLVFLDTILVSRQDCNPDTMAVGESLRSMISALYKPERKAIKTALDSLKKNQRELNRINLSSKRNSPNISQKNLGKVKQALDKLNKKLQDSISAYEQAVTLREETGKTNAPGKKNPAQRQGQKLSIDNLHCYKDDIEAEIADHLKLLNGRQEFINIGEKPYYCIDTESDDNSQPTDYYGLHNWESAELLLHRMQTYESEVLSRGKIDSDAKKIYESEFEQGKIDTLFNCLSANLKNYFNHSDNHSFRQNLNSVIKETYSSACISIIIDLARESAIEDVLFTGKGHRITADRPFLLSFYSGSNGPEGGEKDNAEEKFDIDSMFAFLICDAVFCLYKITEYCQIYGISHMNTHSLLASTYAKLGSWASRFNAYSKYYNTRNGKNSHSNKINEYLTDLIRDDRHTLRKSYQNEMAIQHYRAAKEMHNEGKAYRDQLENMFYLNDDFNDNRYHFSAAIERYWINTEVIDERFKKLKMELNKSSLYNLENYDR